MKTSPTFWYKAMRPHAFGQSQGAYIFGALLGLSLLNAKGSLIDVVDGLLALLGFVGVMLVHGAVNLFDDYFDYKGGAVALRQELIDGGVRSRQRKCWYIISGEATLEDTKRVALILLIGASLIGGMIFVFRGWPILIFAGAGLLLGISYAGPPFRLSYHGFGEIAIGILFGPLVAMPAYYIVSGTIDARILLVALVPGLLTMNIVNTHAIMDFDSDKAANRTTFTVLLGSKRAGLVANIVVVCSAYAIICLAAVLGYLPLSCLLVLLTIPYALGFFNSLNSYVSGKSVEVRRPWWMGPAKNWNAHVENRMDWFFLRWLMARNLNVMFCILVGLLSFVNLGA